MGTELSWLPDVLQAAGLPIEVAPDFMTWSRPYAMDLWGGIWHHTASGINSSRQTNINVVHNGNTVAPGPIAHILSCREQPRLYLVSAGYCNNAGKGWWPAGTDSGNKRAAAMEWVNNGIGELAHPESVEVSARAWAAIFKHMGWPLERLWTHHAYAPTRKIDPAAPAAHTEWKYRTWTLAEVRGLVAPYMQGEDMDCFIPLQEPVRHIDTREGRQGIGYLAAETPVTVPRPAEVPPNATAIAMNITVVGPADAGFVKVWPGGLNPLPITSNINFWPGAVIANFAIVRSEAGSYGIYSKVGTHLIIDITGYFVPSAVEMR